MLGLSDATSKGPADVRAHFRCAAVHPFPRIFRRQVDVRTVQGATTLMYSHFVSLPVKPELVELIGKEHTLRVLLALRAAEGPMRFGELEGALAANPAQVDRALKWLQERLYVIATTVPSARGPIHVTYELSRRGSAFIEAFDTFRAGVEKRRDILGERCVRELDALAG